MNLRYPLFLLFVILFSCEKDEIQPKKNYSPKISFDISNHLLQGTSVKQIEFAENGHYYSVGNKIYFLAQTGIETVFEATSSILSLAFNPKHNSLYFGTKSSGLGKLKDGKINYFTAENSDLTRDLIRDVECDKSGNVWFNASASQIGGLMKFDGKKFTKYLPENSNLPENLIYSIQVLNNKIYVLSKGKETAKVVIEIDGNRWKELFESGGCFPTDMDVTSGGDIFYIEDSREYCGGGLFPDEIVFSFKNNQKTMLREHGVSEDMPHLLRVDKRDYVWAAKFPSGSHEMLSVYDGEKWNEAPEDFPDEVFINCIETDDDNNIWLGTNNGIYILNQ